MRKLPRTNSGQALLIMVVTMAGILILLVSVASRSIVDIKTTSFEKEALRSFSAAEAGVEEALLTGVGSTETLDPGTDTSFETTFDTPAVSSEFVHPGSFVSGETATFWFTERDTDGNFTCTGNCYRGPRINNICWGVKNPGGYDSGKMPAVEILVYYDDTFQSVSSPNDYSGVKVSRRVFDPVESRSNTNNFDYVTPSSCSIGDTTFSFQTGEILFEDELDGGGNQIGFPGMPAPGLCSNFQGCVLMVKVKMLYNDDSGGTDPFADRMGINVQATGLGLAPQGVRIESVGRSGESTRKFEVFQGYNDPPPVFENAIFSYEDLTKP
jgi:hypothetical protein